MLTQRTDIERALDELISHEEGLRFQALAVVLAKQKWPQLIAHERKSDSGLDAYAPGSPLENKSGLGLACSLTASLGKIRADLAKARKHFPDLEIAVFSTPEVVTRKKADGWADKIRQEFHLALVVISREDLITSLLLPGNASLCASHLGITVPIEPDVQDLAQRARQAISQTITSLEQHQLAARPQLALRMVRLKKDRQEDLASLNDVRVFLREGRRITVEAPAGRGKTTTLAQLARQSFEAGDLPLLIDLPEWITSRSEILEFASQAPEFRRHDIDAGDLAKLSESKNISFLLNGWNEISEDQSGQSVIALRQLDRGFPSAGIIVATRNHYISPPLAGAFRFEILLLLRDQRNEYIEQSVGNRANELKSLIDENPALDELTRIPLILSEVTTIFQAGQTVPATKLGVLDATLTLVEQKVEHQSALRTAPLLGHARHYLGALALHMGRRSEVTILESDARATVHGLSEQLLTEGQISTIPEPASLLNGLCAHHILERREYPTVAYRFEHQQFQEFFAALMLKERLAECIRNPSERGVFVSTYIDEPAWDEPLQMIAEEIGRTPVPQSHSESISTGKLLIEMTLDVDPIFAAELSKLCGPEVWKGVANSVSDRLRPWFQVPDHNHKHCALVGMLATGSQEFNDILMPLLMNDDQQVRLATYRAGRGFDPSILGPNWRRVVSAWSDESRIEFLHEVTLSRWRPRLVEDFSRTDPSLAVRAEAIEMLCHVGPEKEAARILSSLNNEEFEVVVQKLPAKLIPLPLRERAVEAYRRLAQRSGDSDSRLRLLLEAFKLGDATSTANLKAELDRWHPTGFNFPHSVLVTDLLNAIRGDDPGWVSNWIATRMAGGTIWGDSWAKLITRIPDAIRDELFAAASSGELEHRKKSSSMTLLTINPDPSFALAVFEKMCATKTEILAAESRHDLPQHAILRQLEDILRNIPPEVAITGLSARLATTGDLTILTELLEVWGRFSSEDADLRTELEDDLRRCLRDYLKKSVPFALSQNDYSGQLKSYLATALSRVGEPEDMDDLVNLIRADLQRMRAGRAARLRGERSLIADGGIISYTNWYVRAITTLDSEHAPDILLDLLSQQEYEGDCARALESLARNQPPETGFLQASRNYSRVWEARAGHLPTEFDDGRRRRFATAIADHITSVMRGVRTGAAAMGYWFKPVAKILADLDAVASRDLVLEALSLPSKWDGGARVGGLQALLFGGAQLPTEQTLQVLEPAIAQARQDLNHGDQNRWLLVQCLSVLPFLEASAGGINRIREILSEVRLPKFELQPLIVALGASRTQEALQFLRELAGKDGSGIKEIAKDWITAVAMIGGAKADQILMSFTDPDVHVFESEVNFQDSHDYDVLATRIAALADAKPSLKERIFALCNRQLSASRSLLVAKIIARFGTEEGLIEGLNLIHDNSNPRMHYDLSRAIEDFCMEKRPYGDSINAYSLEPRPSNRLRRKLFDMALNDTIRRQSAFALLGEIEAWRVERGKPITERRHPALESGAPWPLAIIRLAAAVHQ